MMLQNYTYVDPVMDPVVLLTLLLGLVFLTAAVVVFFTIRALPEVSATNATPTPDAPPAFVSPAADRLAPTLSGPFNVRWPEADATMTRAADRGPERSDAGRSRTERDVPVPRQTLH